MEVLIEKKMIDIKSEPVSLAVDKPRRRSTSTPAELEPSEEFPILYGLLTAPKSFKPRNSDELQFLPMLRAEGNLMGSGGVNEDSGKEEDKKLLLTSRVQLVQCRRKSNSRRESRRSRSQSSDSGEEEEDIDQVSIYEEADSQNLDFCRSSSSSPQTVDSSSNMSGQDENNSPLFMNYLSGNLKSENSHHECGNNERHHQEEEEEEEDDDRDFSLSRVSSPGGGSMSGGDESNLDDNIPTSTTSGFRRKAFRLEHAIGNIVKRRRVQKRPTNSNNNNHNSDSSNTVPISMAPSSPTVSTTCVDPPSQPAVQQRGRSEILERILRSNTTTTNTRSTPSHSPAGRQPLNDQSLSRWGNNDDNNNNDNGSHEPFAKLRDLLTMPEDQLVKRRRIEYGISEENKNEQEPVSERRAREFSPPRNNILASLLQKGRAPYDPISSYNLLQRNNAPSSQLVVAPPSIHKISDSNNIRNNSGNNNNDERPYKCSLCDLRFKKLPLLNRHVKTHSHIKRYVCRFCSHAFKRSDNLLAHMRTSCKGIKEADTKFSTAATSGGHYGQQRVPSNNNNNNNIRTGQIIPQLLSAPPAGPLSPMVSRSQLEEALLNLNEKRYVNSPASSPLVSTTTGSPPPPKVLHRPVITPGPDFQAKHSKLLEILSGSPVVANRDRFRMDLEAEEDEEEEMPLPLSLKVERRAESPPPTCSSSSPSPNQSHFLRSHLQQNIRRLYSNNELPLMEEEQEEMYEDEEGREVHLDEEEENDNEQPLDLGRHRQAPTQHEPSVRSRDHPEIVSILSRQPKNVMMLGPDIRKLVGIDTL